MLNETILQKYLQLEIKRKEIDKELRELEKEISPLKATILESIPSDSNQVMIGNILAFVKYRQNERMVSKEIAIQKHGLSWLEINGLLSRSNQPLLTVTEVKAG